MVQIKDPVKAQNRTGFSLLESVASLLVFMIASVGWMSLESNLLQTTTQSQSISSALFLAQSRIETLRQISYVDLVASKEKEGLTPTGETDNEDPFYLLDVAVLEVPEDDPTRKQVRVQVAWNLDADVQETIQLYFERSQ